MNVVLYEPEIPANTGNIGRTCLGTDTTLHLIKPLGFSLDDKYVKRSGMDYWKYVKIEIYEDFDDFLRRKKEGNMYFLSTKGNILYSDEKYDSNDYLIFGPESRGIPEEILDKYSFYVRTIPMVKNFRSLNLSNAVAIVLYEAIRQMKFPFPVETGKF